MTFDASRVLMLAPQAPFPPEQGAALRNYNILRYLAQRHRVTLIAFGDPAEIRSPLQELCEQVVMVPAPVRPTAQRLAEQLLPTPDLAIRLRSAAFGAALARVCRRRRFAVVQCEGLELYRYASTVPAPLILDAHNAEWRLQQVAYLAALRDCRLAPAIYSLLQWRKLARYEGLALRQAGATFAVSALDQRDLQHIAPDADVTVLANGVDAELYQPLIGVVEDADSILFAGKMDFRPNVEGALWLARRIMPRVWSRRPAARLVLFGRNPTPAVRRLAADPRITVTGHVPGIDAEKMALARASVIAVPLLSGGGTRLKVLHSLAMARPLVSTPLGAAGYALRSGQHLLLADGTGQFAAALLQLLEQRDLAYQLGVAGRATVQQNYTWERLLPLLDSTYARVCRG